MSQVFEALRRADERRRLGGFRQPPGRQEGDSALRWLASEPHPAGGGHHRARVVTLASLKGGVGKTVIAANLAVYLRALRPQVPTLLLACDDDPLADRMFARTGANPGAACATFPSAPEIRGGRYGVFTLRPSRPSWGLGSPSEPGCEVGRLLGATDWDGLVVVDTPPDFGARTRGALAASDVVLVPVSDTASLDKVAQLFALMDDWGLPRDGVHLLLSQLDLRIKYREGESRDVLALLVSEIRRRGWPLLGAFLSRTPKVASLYTKESGRPLPIAAAVPASVVHRQFQHLADDVLGLLACASQRTAPADPSARREIACEVPGRPRARPSFRGAGRGPLEVHDRAERPRPGTWRAVGLVLLVVVAGPALALAVEMLIAINLRGGTVNEVTFANGSGDPPSGFVTDDIAPRTGNDLVSTMLDAKKIGADATSFGLFDDGNDTNANVRFASFSWSPATDMNSQVGNLSVLPVPEPSTALLLAAGLLGLGVRRRALHR